MNVAATVTAAVWLGSRQSFVYVFNSWELNHKQNYLNCVTNRLCFLQLFLYFFFQKLICEYLAKRKTIRYEKNENILCSLYIIITSKRKYYNKVKKNFLSQFSFLFTLNIFLVLEFCYGSIVYTDSFNFECVFLSF